MYFNKNNHGNNKDIVATKNIEKSLTLELLFITIYGVLFSAILRAGQSTDSKYTELYIWKPQINEQIKMLFTHKPQNFMNIYAFTEIFFYKQYFLQNQ